MLCPAAVSAAAAAVWLLAVLGPGLSLPAEDNSEPGFTPCSHCFYRQTPPLGASAGPLLQPLCHRLPGGQAFATLHRPTCDTAVYSAFHLSHGWTEGEGHGGEGLVTDEEENIQVPALLRGSEDPSHPVSPTDSPLQRWDSTVTSLVRSAITPQCSILGGDLYLLIGAGGLGSAEDGDEECQMNPLWSAVCCAVPEVKGGVGVGLIRETGEGLREVSVKELEEILGVTELFSDGCGGADGEIVGLTAGLNSEAHPGNIEKLDSDTTDQNTEREGEGLDTRGQDSNKDIEKRRDEMAGMPDAQSDDADSADVKQETSTYAASSESSNEYAALDELGEDTNSSSTVVFILSTALSILKAPLRPVFSTITHLPGQVTYVLQEDLGVLSALPGETFSLVHLLTSDLFSWTGSAAEMLLDIGETCFFGVYYCSSSMLEALVSSCQAGVTGMGTLAGDIVGIFGDILDNAWWVTKFFGGRLWEQSEGYVGTVMSEMGGQAKSVGGGLGSLAWRSGNGVGNVLRLGGDLIMGMVDKVTVMMRESFGQESE